RKTLMRGFDLEALREIFRDNRIHIAVGVIKKMIYASDKSSLDRMVSIFPEAKEIVAQMSWEAVGPESGCFFPPSVLDMVLVAIVEGDDDQAFIIKRLTSREDKIPINVVNGDVVLKALSGKKLWA